MALSDEVARRDFDARVDQLAARLRAAGPDDVARMLLVRLAWLADAARAAADRTRILAGDDAAQLRAVAVALAQQGSTLAGFADLVGRPWCDRCANGTRGACRGRDGTACAGRVCRDCAPRGCPRCGTVPA